MGTLELLRRAVKGVASIRVLTIAQPYPYLILTPPDELPTPLVPKRVENRTWEPGFSGLMLIHSGKDLSWLTEEGYPIANPSVWLGKRTMEDFPELDFGAIVGAVRVSISIPKVMLDSHTDLGAYEWVKTHVHATGPHCWVLSDPVRFLKPIPYRGSQKVWKVDPSVIREQVEILCQEVVS